MLLLGRFKYSILSKSDVCADKLVLRSTNRTKNTLSFCLSNIDFFTNLCTAELPLNKYPTEKNGYWNVVQYLKNTDDFMGLNAETIGLIKMSLLILGALSKLIT